MIDLHSHILPGIDDGAKTFEDSVKIVKELCGQGITDMVATPHYICETNYVSTRANNAKLLNELKKRLKQEEVEVNLYLGNEIYIDSTIRKLLDGKKIATLADSKYVLVEFPLNGQFPNYEDILGDLIQSGYKVILAHPERYVMVQEDFQVLQDLYDVGVLLQCNLGSFLGKYGKREEKIAIRLAKEGMIFGFGSDIHHCRGDKSIAKAIKKLRRYYSQNELERVLIQNPRKVINA